MGLEGGGSLWGWKRLGGHEGSFMGLVGGSLWGWKRLGVRRGPFWGLKGFRWRCRGVCVCGDVGCPVVVWGGLVG